MPRITQYFAPVDKALAAASSALNRDQCAVCERSLRPVPVPSVANEGQPSRVAPGPHPPLPNLCVACAAAEQQRELFEYQLEQRSRDQRASRLDLVYSYCTSLNNL